MEHAYVRRIYLRGFASYVIMNFSTSLFKDVSAKNFYSTDFLIHLQQSGNELPLSKMQKKIGASSTSFSK